MNGRAARTVIELRLATAVDIDDAVAFFRDALGLPEHSAVSSPEGNVVILDAGRATLN